MCVVQTVPMGAMLEKSVQRLVDGEIVREASLLQHRDSRAKVALGIGFVLGIAAAFIIDGGSLITGAFVGLGAGLAQMPFVDYWVIARIDDEVVFCRSSPWFGRAKEVTHRGVVVERDKQTWLADIYSSPLGELTGSSLRRREIDRILMPVTA